MRSAVVCCLLAACGFDHGKATLGDGGVVVDDATDAEIIDGPEECMTYSSQLDTCARTAGTLAVELTGSNTYNTDTGVLMTPQGPLGVQHEVISIANGEIDVIFVASFTLAQGGTLRVTGANSDRPFGIASAGAVQINGILDLSVNGAGARDDDACTSEGAKGTNESEGAGGGGGAAFGGAGGNGGAGNLNGAADTPGGPGGTAVTRPAHPLGGCDGGDGGDAGGANGGAGGDGGGAVLVATPQSISIGPMGAIAANGGGGKTGTGQAAGGGGGGSGGFILLEAASITNAGKIVANGGGGAEGAGSNPADDGDDGYLSAMRARGGSMGDSQGGNGGDGGAGNTPEGEGPSDVQNGGGGGGGGGVGFIATTADPTMTGTGAVISPPRQAWQ